MLELTLREYKPQDEDFVHRKGPIWEVCDEILPTRDAWKYVRPMINLVEKLDGYGLSANQVGLKLPLFITTIGKEKIACYRPKIVSVNRNRGELVGREKCLSFPGAALEIARPFSVNVEFIAQPNGKMRRLTLEGLAAIGFQHEYDHLQGITIFHRYAQQLEEAKLAAIKRAAAKVNFSVDRVVTTNAEAEEYPVTPLKHIYDPTKD